MQEPTNRQLIDRALVNYTAAGWQVVSQSDTGMQVMLPHTVSANVVALFVIAPLIVGVIAALFSIAFGSALFSLALLFAALIALDHLTKRPKLLYVTADQLRNPVPAAAIKNSAGVTVCSVCQQPVRADASVCKNCNTQFART